MAKQVQAYSTSNTMPAFMDNDQAPDIMQNASDGGFTTHNISLRGGKFRLRHGRDEIKIMRDEMLEVVIIGVVGPGYQRSWFDGAFDPTNPLPPACQSINGVAPHAGSLNPQAENCNVCPRNQKTNKKPDGSYGRECGFSKRLLVMIPGEDIDNIYTLDLKGMSIFGNEESKDGFMGWKKFVAKVDAKGQQLYKIVTGLRFDEQASVPKVQMHPLGFVNSKEVYDAILAHIDSDKYKELIEMKDVLRPIVPSVAALADYKPDVNNAQAEGAEAASEETFAPEADGFNESALDDAMTAR